MKQININFENCYGIKKLNYQFKFNSEYKTYFIYSPNGTMKTSFLKTFKNYNSEKDEDKPCDQIDKTLKSIYEIKDELGTEIDKNKILTIESLPDVYHISDQVNMLLLNTKLKIKYEEIKNQIDSKKDQLIQKMFELSKLKNKKEFEEEFYRSFASEYAMQGFKRVENEIRTEEFSEYSDIEYNTIFNDKIMQLLKDSDFIEKLSNYVEEYNLLISKSTFFKSGFNHYQADEILKKLKENGFFQANHHLKLSNGDEIKNEEELKKLIDSEKNNILSNMESKKIFDTIDKKIQKNVETRKFLNYITENPNVADLLFKNMDKIDIFKQKILKGYIQKNIEIYDELIETERKSEQEIKNIKNNIKENNTKWHDVISIFNERFNVPFEVMIENIIDTILGDNPKICFKFKNIPIKEDILKRDILSNGEKRALYLLNIIFEIEIRKLKKQETLFIIDDIADSFDYKNKYAIIEYLNDISKIDDFYQIILTHNYDFFRTIIKRLDHSRNSILFAMKSDNEIIIEEAFYQNKNPLIIFKEELHDIGCKHNADGFMPICAIPFARNIVEYTKSIQDKNYLMLTSLLHIKTDSYNIKLLDLKNILHDTINSNNIWVGYSDLNKSVIKYIYEKADFILKNNLNKKYLVRLEPKIILSIACRLKMEEFLIEKFKEAQIKYEELIADKNQTRELIELLKNRLPDEYSKIEGILEKLLIITSENIHLNSFMYEPLLDISNCELIDLYKNINDIGL